MTSAIPRHFFYPELATERLATDEATNPTATRDTHRAFGDGLRDFSLSLSSTFRPSSLLFSFSSLRSRPRSRLMYGWAWTACATVLILSWQPPGVGGDGDLKSERAAALIG